MESFGKAVWKKVYADLTARLTHWASLVVEFAVFYGVTFTVLSQLGSADAVWDFSFEKLLAGPIVLFVLMVIHAAWSWAKAPRTLYYEQQQEISGLAAGLAHRDSQLALLRRQLAEAVATNASSAAARQGDEDVLRSLENLAMSVRRVVSAPAARAVHTEGDLFLSANFGVVAADDFNRAIEQITHDAFDRAVNATDVRNGVIAKLNTQLMALLNQKRTEMHHRESAEKQKAYSASTSAKRESRLADTKAAIMAQIDAAERCSDYDDKVAWIESTNDLLLRINLGVLPNKLFHPNDESSTKKRFQGNITYLRSLLITTTIANMPYD